MSEAPKLGGRTASGTEQDTVATRRRYRGTGVMICLLVLASGRVTHAGLNEWTSGAGAPGGTLRAVAVNPLSPGIVYAGTSGIGVVRSLDGGGTWLQTNAGLPAKYISAFAVNPLNPAIVYAGADSSSETIGGVFRSADGGTTWAEVTTGLGRPTVTALAIDPLTPGDADHALRSDAPGSVQERGRWG